MQQSDRFVRCQAVNKPVIEAASESTFARGLPETYKRNRIAPRAPKTAGRVPNSSDDRGEVSKQRCAARPAGGREAISCGTLRRWDVFVPLSGHQKVNHVRSSRQFGGV